MDVTLTYPRPTGQPGGLSPGGEGNGEDKSD